MRLSSLLHPTVWKLLCQSMLSQMWLRWPLLLWERQKLLPPQLLRQALR
ncbi:hypothetical protein BER2_4593 [plant metagenome]|uniref:Uncharacterized protein n=1 Tax=plant metagenome TaxID=1297885 RepID=A0A484RLT0_9ZZZZ